ncbi:unnamed protein product [Gadus morhua 'NCC']
MPELATIPWAKPNDVHSRPFPNADPKHWTDCTSSPSKVPGMKVYFHDNLAISKAIWKRQKPLRLFIAGDDGLVSPGQEWAET